MPAGVNLMDLPAEETRFVPPSADAVLLFSDGQFDLPAFAPPTYPVIDPLLDEPEDSAVTQILQVDQGMLAEVRHFGQPRTFNWRGAATKPVTITESAFLHAPLSGGVSDASAILSPGDLWPENDALAIDLPPPTRPEQWWIGDAAPAGWRQLNPAEVPQEPARWTEPSVVVLQDIPADALSSSQQQQLDYYVRAMGGALVIVGGPHAFAAGGYSATLLDNLSPLASTPPQPAVKWVLLIDASGSMAGTPWKTELAVLTNLLPKLPPADPVSLGSFAENVSWWSSGLPAVSTAKLTLPPTSIFPHGPTNLAAALEQVQKDESNFATQMLVVTDADAELPPQIRVIETMKARNLHLQVLAIGQGTALAGLREISAATGGSVVVQLDPLKWIESANQLLRMALPDHYQHRTIDLTPTPPASISDWNQTWLKEGATRLQGSGDIATIAQWRAGLGEVIAIAYPPASEQAARTAASIQQLPADPRFVIQWTSGSKLRVSVDATDGGHSFNGANLSMEAASPALPTNRVQMVQTGPGHYEAQLPSSRTTRLITVKQDQRVLRRFAISGRYAPEFDRIGNDRDALSRLANRSGGRLINPSETSPLSLRKPARQIDLMPHLTAAAFLIIAAGLVLHRRTGR